MESLTSPVQQGSTPQLAKTSPVLDAKSLISQLRAIIHNEDAHHLVDPSQRQEIQQLSLAVSRRLELPYDGMMRLLCAPLQLVVTRIGQDHGLFAALVKAGRPVSLQELSEATGLPLVVAESVMDYLCVHDVVRPAKAGLFEATELTGFLDDARARSGTILIHDVMVPGFFALNEQLKESDSDMTAFQKGSNTKDSFYAWLETHPFEKKAFHDFMRLQDTGLPSWTDVLDVQAEFGKDVTDGDALFVDIGGGSGHECKALKAKSPGARGRVILQDRADVVGNALNVPGLETMAHNYLTEQPVKNARVYFLRQILHNNDDELCTRIIRSILPAMGPGSHVVVVDKVLPDEISGTDKANAEFSSAMSLGMYILFRAQERREGHWRKLLTSAGLEVKEVRRITHFDAIIIAKKQS